jgi:hypothetical protein
MISWAASSMGDPDEVVIKMTPLQEVAAKLPPEVGAAAQEWMTGYPDKDLKAFLAFSPAALEQ